MSVSAKPKYRTTNWKASNAALKTNSLLLNWLDQGLCWHGSASSKQGRSPKYSEAASQFRLSVKNLFHLALRQAMGMVPSLLKLAGLAYA